MKAVFGLALLVSLIVLAVTANPTDAAAPFCPAKPSLRHRHHDCPVIGDCAFDGLLVLCIIGAISQQGNNMRETGSTVHGQLCFLFCLTPNISSAVGCGKKEHDVALAAFIDAGVPYWNAILLQ